MAPKKPNAFLKSNLFVNTWSIWCILPWLNFSQEATLRKVWLIVSPTKYILYPAIFNHPTVILLAIVYIANSSHPDKYLHIKSSPDLSDVTPNMFHNRVCCTCKCIEIVIHICLIQKALIRTQTNFYLGGTNSNVEDFEVSWRGRMKKAVMWHKCLPYWCLSAPAPPLLPYVANTHTTTALYKLPQQKKSRGGRGGGLNLSLGHIKRVKRPPTKDYNMKTQSRHITQSTE